VSTERDPQPREPDREAPRPEVAAAPPQGGLAGHVLGLQRTAGNQAVTRMVSERHGPRLAREVSMPLGGRAPGDAKYTELATFLEVIRKEEAKQPIADQTNTKLMVTKLRKLFYGSEAWDKYLIPGAAGVKGDYKWQEKETKRTEMEIPYAPNVDVVDKESTLVNAPDELAKPGTFQEVRMPNGDFVDVGHVLAGLDAFNNPSTAGDPLGLYTIDDNAAAVTWLGDLGSIAGEVLIKTMLAGKKTYTESELQAAVTEMAPSQDMLGNVDAYVINNAFDVNTAAGKKVSDILAEFYGGAKPSGLGNKRSTRFTTFARLIGLGDLVGNAFVHEGSFKMKWLPQLRNSTSLYVGTRMDLTLTGSASYAGAMSGAGSNAVNIRLLDVFVAELRAAVAAETPAAAPAP
jgi:hypothetical protein